MCPSLTCCGGCSTQPWGDCSQESLYTGLLLLLLASVDAESTDPMMGDNNGDICSDGRWLLRLPCRLMARSCCNDTSGGPTFGSREGSIKAGQWCAISEREPGGFRGRAGWIVKKGRPDEGERSLYDCPACPLPPSHFSHCNIRHQVRHSALWKLSERVPPRFRHRSKATVHFPMVLGGKAQIGGNPATRRREQASDSYPKAPERSFQRYRHAVSANGGHTITSSATFSSQ